MSDTFYDHNSPENLYSLLAGFTATQENRTGLISFFPPDQYRNPRNWTFSEINHQVTRTANMFFSLGVKKGDVVAVVLPEIAESYFAIWGAASVGVALPIHPGLETYQIADLIASAGAKILVTTGPMGQNDLWDRIAQFRPHLPELKTILQVDLTAKLGFFQRTSLRASLRGKGKAEKIAGQEIGDFNLTLAKFADSPSFPLPDPDDTAIWFHSPETWHEPTLTSFSHREVMDTALSLKNPGQSPVWPAFHLSHSQGFIAGKVSAWAANKTVICGEEHSPEKLQFFKVDSQVTPALPDNPKWKNTQGIPLHRLLETEDKLLDITLVEKFAEQHPMVKDVVAIPSPDRKKGWAPVIFVSPQTNGPVLPRDIYDFLVQKIPAKELVPAGIRIIDKLPRSSTGDIAVYLLCRNEIENTLKQIPGVANCKAICEEDGEWRVNIWLSSAGQKPAVAEQMKGFLFEIDFFE
ncbi:MAG: AMP-binding protein [Bacteroidia bacterium]